MQIMVIMRISCPVLAFAFLQFVAYTKKRQSLIVKCCQTFLSCYQWEWWGSYVKVKYNLDFSYIYYISHK